MATLVASSRSRANGIDKSKRQSRKMLRPSSLFKVSAVCKFSYNKVMCLFSNLVIFFISKVGVQTCFLLVSYFIGIINFGIDGLLRMYVAISDPCLFISMIWVEISGLRSFAMVKSSTDSRSAKYWMQQKDSRLKIDKDKETRHLNPFVENKIHSMLRFCSGKWSFAR